MTLRYTRHIRVVFLFIYVLCFSYSALILRHHEAELPDWAQVIKSSNWTRVWSYYDLQHLSDIYHSSHNISEVSVTPRQEGLAAVNGTSSAASPAVQTPKVSTNPTGPSPYAYVLPINSDELACAALVNIDRLRNIFRTRYRIIALIDGNIAPEYLEAIRSYNVTIPKTWPPHVDGSNATNNRRSLKLNAFDIHKLDGNLTRVLLMEPDSLILRSPDSVFELPDVDVAAPRAYWVPEGLINPAFILISPSNRVWDMVEKVSQKVEPGTSADDVIKHIFDHTALILPGSYGTQTSHWKKWNTPDWYRPEEIVEMEKAGRTTGNHGLVKQHVAVNIAALGWAVEKWKADLEETEEDVSQIYEVEGMTEDSPANGRAALKSYVDRPTERTRPKRMVDEPDQNRDEAAFRNDQEAQATASEDSGLTFSTELATISGTQSEDQLAENDLALSENLDSVANSMTVALIDGEENREGLAPKPGVVNTDNASPSTAADGLAMQVAMPDTERLAASSNPAVVPIGEEPVLSPSIPALFITTLDDLPTTISSDPEPTPTEIDKAALERPLFDLHRVVHILQFAKDEKPWQREAEGFRVGHEGAHQLWSEHYRQWREMAKKVCPAINKTYLSELGEQWKAEKLVERV